MRQSRSAVTCKGKAGAHLLRNTTLGVFAALDVAAFAAFEACEGPLVAPPCDSCHFFGAHRKPRTACLMAVN